jgi:hypothetical protein
LDPIQIFTIILLALVYSIMAPTIVYKLLPKNKHLIRNVLLLLFGFYLLLILVLIFVLSPKPIKLYKDKLNVIIFTPSSNSKSTDILAKDIASDFAIQSKSNLDQTGVSKVNIIVSEKVVDPLNNQKVRDIVNKYEANMLIWGSITNYNSKICYNAVMTIKDTIYSNIIYNNKTPVNYTFVSADVKELAGLIRIYYLIKFGEINNAIGYFETLNKSDSLQIKDNFMNRDIKKIIHEMVIGSIKNIQK